jgi:hypothetical protein
MNQPEAWKPVPNCAYIQELALRINELNIPWYEARIRDNTLQLAESAVAVPEASDALCELILRREFISDEPSGAMEDLLFMTQRMSLKVAEIHQATSAQLLDLFQGRHEVLLQLRNEQETLMDKHVESLHKDGRAECYRTGIYDIPATHAKAFALRAIDKLLRKAPRDPSA